MKETSARLLRLLALLQVRREWSGQELADRLGVTARTVRRDVDKLRDLDYPVHAVKGIAGGYRLGPGTRLPPLLLDDAEAVAVAIALRTATASSVTGIGETALRALVKLEQVLPDRLRHRVDALQLSTVLTPGAARPTVDIEVLTAVGAACRDLQRLRFDYTGRDGVSRIRDTEPHELVTWGPRWYLVAWDVERADWRSFRVDRIRPRTPNGPRFSPRPLPGGNAAQFVSQRVAQLWLYRATLRLQCAADSDPAQAAATYGQIEAVSAQTCLLHIGADNVRSLVFIIGALDVDFEIVDAPELAEQLRRTARRYQRAAPAD